jgi:hypothetical protein
MLLVASAAIAATLWWSAEAAQPVPSGAAAAAAPITFAQYRDWRNNFVARRRSELAIELQAGGLSSARKATLEPTKAYYDGLAGLSDAERERRYRQRFDQIDTDHDGTMDAAERAAWRDQRRAIYRAAVVPRKSAEAASR